MGEVQVVERGWKRSVEKFFQTLNLSVPSLLPVGWGAEWGNAAASAVWGEESQSLVCFSALLVLLLHFYLVTSPECLINVKSGSCHRSYITPLSAHKSIRKEYLQNITRTFPTPSKILGITNRKGYIYPCSLQHSVTQTLVQPKGFQNAQLFVWGKNLPHKYSFPLFANNSCIHEVFRSPCHGGATCELLPL